MKSRLFLLAALLCLHQQVTAQKPIVDPKSTSPSTTLTKEELDKIPSSHNIADILKTVPTTPPSTNLVPRPLGKAEGFDTTVTTPPGLHTVTIKSPGGDKLEIYLPNHILSGHSFTGGMKVIPAPGNTSNTMDGYSVNVNGQTFTPGATHFNVYVPSGNSFEITFTDKKGKQLGGVNVPVLPSNYSLPPPSFPSSGTSGNLLVINCGCDGRLPQESYFRLNDTPMQILTATPGTIVVLNNSNVPGILPVDTNISGVTAKNFRNVVLKLWADKYELKKGETTGLHIEVAGLQGLKVPAQMTIDASGTIAMGGGNSQKLSIQPGDVSSGGVYKTGNTLMGIAAGGFGVKVTVTVDKEDF